MMVYPNITYQITEIIAKIEIKYIFLSKRIIGYSVKNTHFFYKHCNKAKLFLYPVFT